MASAPPTVHGLTPRHAELLAPHCERIPDPRRALLLLGRWAESHPLPRDERAFLDLAYLAGASEPLFLALQAEPAQLASVSAQSRIPGGLGRDGLDEALARHLLRSRPGDAAVALAAFRLHQCARILLQDLLGVLPFEGVTRELSLLAEVLVGRALALTYQELRERLGMPQKAGPGDRFVPCSLSVFGLGKLGGGELNYSSDVDLVFFFEEEGTTDRGASNGAFFNAWAREAIALLTRPTVMGSCLRVDPNLRPRGRDGELTLSFGSALDYYREWAETWERQAWIKARPVAGDTAAGARFLRQLEPLIYRSVPPRVVAEENRRMRSATLAHLERAAPSGAGPDVKEGPGSIRDAEFAVQALQLAHGPADPWLREPNMLLALARLRQRGLLADARRGELARGYLLLRRAEHFVQVQAMRQAHRLPEAPETREALARFLGLPGVPALDRALAESRGALARIFRETVEALARQGEHESPLARALDPGALLRDLASAGLREADRALPLLAEAYRSLAQAASTENDPGLLELHRAVLGEIGAAPAPFNALDALHRMVPALSSQEGLLVALAGRPRALALLLRVAARSAPALEMVQRWPALAGDLSFEALQAPEAVLGAAFRDARFPDALREAHKRALFLFTAAEVLREAPDPAVSFRRHTRLAERALDIVFRDVCTGAEKREGLPAGTLSDRWCLVGLGRLGFEEMHPRSDLDLVPVKSEEWLLPEDPARSALVEGQLLRALVSGLTAVTRHGSLYASDFRLRPHGDSGPPLAVGPALVDYFDTPHARGWERLAYLKARVVAGSREVGAHALEKLGVRLVSRPLPPGEPGRLSEILSRLDHAAADLEGAVKFAPGGLLHLDLVLLALQTARGLLPGPGGAFALLSRLLEAGALEGAEAEALRASKLWQERLLLHLRLTELRPLPRARAAEVLVRLSRHPWAGTDPEAAWRGHREAVLAAWSRRVEANQG